MNFSLLFHSFRLVRVPRTGLAAAAAALLLALQPAAAAENGLLWKIEKPTTAQPSTEKPSWLMGTIHTDDARVAEFSPALEQALRESQAFLMEILPLQTLAPLMMRQGTLRDHLKPAELEQLLRLADTHALRDELALGMKPWLLSALFSLPRPQSPFTQDIRLYSLARENNKEILGLERPEEHFGALDDLAFEDQLALLRATLAATQQEKEQQFEALVKAYLSRDTERVAAENEQSLKEGLPERLALEVKRRLLEQRNARMAERIMRQAAKMPVFVAVGAAHLSGEDGLVARFRAAGFRVTPVE